jgi:hypothetical protein
LVGSSRGIPASAPGATGCCEPAAPARDSAKPLLARRTRKTASHGYGYAPGFVLGLGFASCYAQRFG